jgi:putative ABC transport system substrate-binding protein
MKQSSTPPVALLVLADPIIRYKQRLITKIATDLGLPTMGPSRDFATTDPYDPTVPHSEVFGLLAYGPDRHAMFRRGAYYVHRLLSSSDRLKLVSELPVEQPTRYDFVVNKTTAHRLGQTISKRIEHLVADGGKWYEYYPDVVSTP